MFITLIFGTFGILTLYIWHITFSENCMSLVFYLIFIIIVFQYFKDKIIFKNKNYLNIYLKKETSLYKSLYKGNIKKVFTFIIISISSLPFWINVINWNDFYFVLLLIDFILIFILSSIIKNNSKSLFKNYPRRLLNKTSMVYLNCIILFIIYLFINLYEYPPEYIYSGLDKAIQEHEKIFHSYCNIINFIATSYAKIDIISLWVVHNFNEILPENLESLFLPIIISYVVLQGLSWYLFSIFLVEIIDLGNKAKFIYKRKMNSNPYIPIIIVLVLLLPLIEIMITDQKIVNNNDDKNIRINKKIIIISSISDLKKFNNDISNKINKKVNSLFKPVIKNIPKFLDEYYQFGTDYKIALSQAAGKISLNKSQSLFKKILFKDNEFMQNVNNINHEITNFLEMKSKKYINNNIKNNINNLNSHLDLDSYQINLLSSVGTTSIITSSFTRIKNSKLDKQIKKMTRKISTKILSKVVKKVASRAATGGQRSISAGLSTGAASCASGVGCLISVPLGLTVATATFFANEYAVNSLEEYYNRDVFKHEIETSIKIMKGKIKDRLREKYIDIGDKLYIDKLEKLSNRDNLIEIIKSKYKF